MTDTHAQDDLLQQYFDGELLPTQAARVEADLARDPGYRARYEALTRMRQLVELSAEEAASEVDFDALYSRIEEDVSEDRRAPALSERLSVWWQELVAYRPALAFGTPVAIAAAAALFIWAGPAAEPTADGTSSPSLAEGSSDSSAGDVARYAEPRKPAVALAQNSEVVQVDFGNNTGTVFEIALADGVSTPVVWINDEE